MKTAGKIAVVLFGIISLLSIWLIGRFLIEMATEQATYEERQVAVVDNQNKKIPKNQAGQRQH